MNRRAIIIPILFIVLATAILSPLSAYAIKQWNWNEPLIPCISGGKEYDPSASGAQCGYAEFIQLVYNLIQFSIYIAIPIFAVVFAYGGVTILFAQGNQGKIDKAKGMLQNAVIGFLVILTAWLIVYTIVTALFDSSFISLDQIR